jgi:hypothetical protein
MKLYSVKKGKESVVNPKKVDDYNFHQDHDYDCDDEEIKGPSRVGLMNCSNDIPDYIVELEKGDTMIFNDSKGKIICKNGDIFGFGNEPCQYEVEDYIEMLEENGEYSAKTFKKFNLDVVIDNS